MINNIFSFDNFKEKKINGVKIYSVSNDAIETYRKNAKNDAKISRDILERKLTAMVMSSNVNNKLNGKDVYRFSGFAMIVNERTKKIETISWLRDNHASYGVTKEIGKLLKQNYKLLGLNARGNNYSKEAIVV